MKYSKRITCPEKTNKYYNNGSYNPYAYNYGMFQHNGNCTCYAFGRFSENLGYKSKLAPYDAKDWYEYNDGYKRGSTPKLGAVICWGHKTRAGHVAIVEEIRSNGDILVSESGWKSFLFRTKVYTKASGYMTGLDSGYILHGFIYSPNEYEEEIIQINTYSRKEFIKEVQSCTGAVVDGISGPETISKTVTISKSKNNKHAVVKAVQKYLQSLGYDIGSYGADGIFGDDTEKAVKKYQKNNGCEVDGEITARCKTWKKLLGLL